MAWTYEQVMEQLGDKAQPVPGAIIVFDVLPGAKDGRQLRATHLEIAKINVDGGFSVTEDGRLYLSQPVVEEAEDADEVEEAPKPKARRAKKVAPQPEPEPEIDFDLPDL